MWAIGAALATPVALWWLVRIDPTATVLAYLPVALPALLLLRASSSLVWGAAISGAVVGIALLAAAGAGVVFVPVAALAITLEAAADRRDAVRRAAIAVVAMTAILGLSTVIPPAEGPRYCEHRPGVSDVCLPR